MKYVIWFPLESTFPHPAIGSHVLVWSTRNVWAVCVHLSEVLGRGPEWLLRMGYTHWAVVPSDMTGDFLSGKEGINAP